jgi:hypothetical protein
VKVHIQLASQSCTMLSKFVLPKDGNKSVWVVLVGNSGRFRLAVWVNCIVVPLGRWTMIGRVEGCLLVHGRFSPLKWLVAPVSAIDLLTGGEEPRVGVALHVLRLTTFLLLSLGIPCFQVDVTGVLFVVVHVPIEAWHGRQNGA